MSIAQRFTRPSVTQPLSRRHNRSNTAVRRIVAAGMSAALVLGITVVGAGTAGAAAPATAEGRFLSGTVLTTNLSNLVSLTPASATANTTPPAVTDSHPLDVTALNAVDVDLGSGINLLGGNKILTLGAVGQYATASPTGSSFAASGAVNSSGAVGVGAGFPAADATLNLTTLIAAVPALGTALSSGSLQIGAVSATANQTAAGVQSGTYNIASLKLQVNSPLVSGITTTLTSTLAGLQPTVDGVTGVLNGLGLGLVVVSGIPNLASLVSTLATVSVDGGGIVADLNTGTVTVDLAKLLTFQGKDLNSLPRNTDLLGVITTALTADLLPAIQTALAGLVTTLSTAIGGITATVLGFPINAGVLTGVLNPIIAQVIAPVNTLSANLGTTVITPLANALTGLLALTANEQPALPNSGATFTQTALRLGLVPVGHTAQVNLASATVGPNAGPVPTTTSLSPNHGPAAGGTSVTITGANFVPNATTVTIGGTTIPAGSVTVNGAGTTATFTTPAHAVGAVPVIVTAGSGASDPALTYTYDLPSATGIAPDHGPVTGGTPVVVTGTGFVPGSTSVSIGGTTVAAGDVTITNNGTTASFTTPAHGPGAVPVTLTTPAGTTTPALTFVYGPPSSTTLTPNHGPAIGGTSVIVTGVGFVPGATSVSIGGNTVAASAVAVNPAGTTATFTTPAHSVGTVNVTLTTAGGTSTPALPFTYDPPSASDITPNHGPVIGGTPVVITGTGFVQGGTTVSIGGNTVPADQRLGQQRRHHRVLHHPCSPGRSGAGHRHHR